MPVLQPGTNILFKRIYIMNQTQDYAIGWGTLASINAGIAQGKNRSGLNWFLLSILFGPIATFILVAFYDNLPPKNSI